MLSDFHLKTWKTNQKHDFPFRNHTNVIRNSKCDLWMLNTDWVLLKLRECGYVCTDISEVVEKCRDAYVWQKYLFTALCSWIYWVLTTKCSYIDFGFLTFTLPIAFFQGKKNVTVMALQFISWHDFLNGHDSAKKTEFFALSLRLIPLNTFEHTYFLFNTTFSWRLFRTCRRACYIPIYSIGWSKCWNFTFLMLDQLMCVRVICFSLCAVWNGLRVATESYWSFSFFVWFVYVPLAVCYFERFDHSIQSQIACVTSQ